MRRHHPKPFNQIPISHKVDIGLNLASMIHKLGLEPWEIVEEAVHDWLAKNEPGAIPMPTVAGVQWKKLFLPNGTVLRTVFGGKNFHCRVEDEALRYEGKPTSPSSFANLVGGIRRNAWKVIWVLFPETQTWQLADDLRPARPRRPTRSRVQANRPAHDESRRQATSPTRPEVSTRCRRRGELAPVDLPCCEHDVGQNGKQQQSGEHQLMVLRDRQTMQGAEQRAAGKARQQGGAHDVRQALPEYPRRRRMDVEKVDNELPAVRERRRLSGCRRRGSATEQASTEESLLDGT